MREMGKKKEASESHIEALRHRLLYPKAIFNLAAMAQAGKNNAAAAQFFKLFLSVEEEVSADPKSIGYSVQMRPRAVATAHPSLGQLSRREEARRPWVASLRH